MEFSKVYNRVATLFKIRGSHCMTLLAELFRWPDFVFDNLFFVHNSFTGNESCREPVAKEGAASRTPKDSQA